ncbi:hypothetical protein GCM10027277_54270 [Pseudoduganella ginsengisoli]
MDGYRALRNTITNASLGDILTQPVELAREVRADRYGIRTFVRVDGTPIKFEIVSEGRIDICTLKSCLPMPTDVAMFPLQAAMPLTWQC